MKITCTVTGTEFNLIETFCIVKELDEILQEEMEEI